MKNIIIGALAVEGSVNDLETGQQAMVFGQTNSDGSVSATDIQLGSGFRLDREQGTN